MKKYIVILAICVPLLIYAQKRPFKYGKISQDELKMESCEFYPEAESMILGKFADINFQYVNDKGFQYKYDVTVRKKIFKVAGKEVAKQGIEAGVALVPGLANIYAILKAATDAKSAIATLYGTDQNFQGQPALDKMKMDPNVSKIVDNKIENAFISDLLRQLDGMGDDDPLPDLNVAMQQFLARQFDGNMVKK